MFDKEMGLDAEVESEGVVAGDPPAEEAEVRTFTQEQVDRIAGKAREEGRRRGYEDARAEMVSRYGLESEDEMDDIYGKGSRFDELSERYGSQGSELRDVRAENALLKAHIAPERYGDVKAILAAKGMEVCEDAIASEIGSHPEWVASEPMGGGAAVGGASGDGVGPTNRVAPVEPVGAIPSPASAETDEERSRKEAERLFGFRFK